MCFASNNIVTPKENPMTDSLGCICLYEEPDECARNCRPDATQGEWLEQPEGPPSLCIQLNPNLNDLTQAASECVEELEQHNPEEKIVSVEADSSGLLRIWFQ
jgi:hypothetical protein